MLVVVRWNKSPRRKYGIPRAPGSTSVLTFKKAKEIHDDDPSMFFSGDFELAIRGKESEPEVKDTMQKEVRTRPVKK